jgi:tetratricopeptide (TPR) repeat protein
MILSFLRFFILCLLFSGGVSVHVFADETIDLLERRVNAYPSNLKLRYILSRAYAQKGKEDTRYYRQSIDQLEEIMRVRQIPVVKFYLGLVHARIGDLDTAIYHWQTIVRSMKPNNLTTLRYLALAFERKKRHTESLEYWNRILKINPDDYKAHYHAALVTLRDMSLTPQLRQAAAIRHFNKVLSRYADHRNTLWYLALTYKSSNQFLKQRQVLQKLVTLAPGEERILREIKENQENVRRQPRDPELAVEPDVKPVSEPVIRHTASTEISEDEFLRAFGSDPEPQEVPVDHVPERVDKVATLPIHSPLSADAELLFNQGMVYLGHKEYDLALFNFLQAQELDPKFAQCYLQIGEVYLKLADSTPTVERFKEHLLLAKQALETAQQLEPDSLLAHAATAKMTQIDKKSEEGFEKAHLAVAASAINSGDLRFATEEFIILLSNGFLSSELVFSMAPVIDKIDAGARLDLRNVLFSLSGPDKVEVGYLQGRLQSQESEEEAFRIFDELFEADFKNPAFFEKLRRMSEEGRTDYVDEYFLGRFLLKNNSFGPAVEYFSKAAGKADSSLRKEKAEKWLTKAREGSSSQSGKGLFTPVMTLHKGAAGRFELFNREKQELVSAEASFGGFFENPAEFGSISEKTAFLENFLQLNHKNYLGKFVLAQIYQLSRLDTTMKKADALLAEVFAADGRDADWYFSMGLLCFKMGNEHVKIFFEQSLRALLQRGWENYEPYSQILAEEAEKLLNKQELEAAAQLINEGFKFNDRSLKLASVKQELLRQSGASAFGYGKDVFRELISDDVFIEVFKGDFGRTVFWSILITLLVFCLAVVLRRRDELKHILDELMGQKSISIPLMTLVGGILLFFFPTGLVVFLPVLLWSFLDDFEQMSFGALLLLLFVLPFILPVGYVNNSDHLRAIMLLENGAVDEAKKIYEQRLSQNPLDWDAKFQTGLIEMNEGRGPAHAVTLFGAIVAEDPGHFSALGNMGVCYARMGDFEQALSYLTQAMNIDPINDKVLYNLAKVHEMRGDLKSASNYLKWIGGSGDRSKRNIERYMSISGPGKAVVFAPFYLSGAIKKHDTWFAPVYKSALSLNLFLFVVWFFMGGGLVGLLWFLKDKMDITVARCTSCEQIICNLCQSVLNNRAICSDCFDSDERRKQGIFYFRKLRSAALFRFSRYINILFPGFSLLTAGKFAFGLLVSLAFWFCFMFWWNEFGVLWNQVFHYQNSFTEFMRLLFLILALIFYALSIFSAFYQFNEKS